MSNIIIFDSYDKQLLEDTIDNVALYLSDFTLKQFKVDKKEFTEQTSLFFEKLATTEKNFIIKESFYTNFVDSMLGRTYYFSLSQLKILERIQLFYFFIESPKPKTIKEIQKWEMFNYTFYKSSLPIKVKVDLKNYEKTLNDFKEQYSNYIIKKNPYLLVKEN